MLALTKPYSYAVALKCSNCHKEYPLHSINTFADCCTRPLVVEYEHDIEFDKEQLAGREHTMWRYAEMLPVLAKENIVSLGEGMTPILELNKLAAAYGFSDLLMKDETNNPTGSFKARGLSMAVSKAKEFGVEHCIIPTAGNAGGALAAYCAKADLPPSYASWSRNGKAWK